ncbi:hypothetical protein TNCV_4034111 [Trichonephila clavipes]|nr:hypothetical protein TNCV_4034111 [Trichonephila clavipes]
MSILNSMENTGLSLSCDGLELSPLQDNSGKVSEMEPMTRQILLRGRVNDHDHSATTISFLFKGDSGSSNFIKSGGKFYTLGITSHGKPNPCDPARPVTFTKVIYFENWIKKHVKDLPKS